MDVLFPRVQPVTKGQALNFFYQRLHDVVDEDERMEADIREVQILYTASILAHFSLTSTYESSGMPVLSSLSDIFDNFVIEAMPKGPELYEMAGAQILLMAGFFRDQVKSRYNIEWYERLGSNYYRLASHKTSSESEKIVWGLVSKHFPFWTVCCHKVNLNLREEALLLRDIFK